MVLPQDSMGLEPSFQDQRSGGIVATHGSNGINGYPSTQGRTYVLDPAAKRRPLSIDGRKGPSQNDLEGMLSSALLDADKEFGLVLHEVDEILKALKSETPDEQTLRVAAHPAVWGAVKRV